MNSADNKKISSLDSIDKKIEKLKLKQEGKSEENDKKNELSSYIKIGFATLTEFFSGLIVSMLIGYGLDKYFDTIPIFLISFMCVGFIVGIRNIYKYINKEL